MHSANLYSAKLQECRVVERQEYKSFLPPQWQNAICSGAVVASANLPYLAIGCPSDNHSEDSRFSTVGLHDATADDHGIQLQKNYAIYTSGRDSELGEIGQLKDLPSDWLDFYALDPEKRDVLKTWNVMMANGGNLNDGTDSSGSTGGQHYRESVSVPKCFWFASGFEYFENDAIYTLENMIFSDRVESNNPFKSCPLTDEILVYLMNSGKSRSSVAGTQSAEAGTQSAEAGTQSAEAGTQSAEAGTQMRSTADLRNTGHESFSIHAKLDEWRRQYLNQQDFDDRTILKKVSQKVAMESLAIAGTGMLDPITGSLFGLNNPNHWRGLVRHAPLADFVKSLGTPLLQQLLAKCSHYDEYNAVFQKLPKSQVELEKLLQRDGKASTLFRALSRQCLTVAETLDNSIIGLLTASSKDLPPLAKAFYEKWLQPTHGVDWETGSKAFLLHLDLARMIRPDEKGDCAMGKEVESLWEKHLKGGRMDQTKPPTSLDKIATTAPRTFDKMPATSLRTDMTACDSSAATSSRR